MLALSTMDVRDRERGAYPDLAARHARRVRLRDRFAEGGVEPKLEDLLTDPLTAAVMRRDGVTEDVLRALISDARQTLRSRVDAA